MAGRTRRSIARALAFWDASALVPLCVRQNNTSQAIAFYNRYQVVVWWSTPVEIASALACLVRMNRLMSADLAKADEFAAALADEWWVIQPSDMVRAKAIQLVERHDLRAADAMQLAAALEWCEDAPRGRVFLAADNKLYVAAKLSGFEAKRV